jgi:hypothetical protein
MRKIYAINIAFVKALYSSCLFSIQFSYFITLHSLKDKKNTLINTTVSYFMMMWFVEYIKIIGSKK